MTNLPGHNDNLAPFSSHIHDAFSKALKSGDCDTLRELFAKYPKTVNQRIVLGERIFCGPPLMIAITHNQYATTKMLLEEYGADPKGTQHYWGNSVMAGLGRLHLKTPLLKAIETGNTALADLLYLYDKDITYKTPSGHNAALVSSHSENPDMMRWVLDKNPGLIHDRNAKGDTPLITALKEEMTDECIDLLLQFGARPTDTEEEGHKRPPLLVVMDYFETRLPLGSARMVDTFKRLVAHGADINIRDHEHATLLMRAARKCTITAVEDMVRMGADVEAVDDEGFTAADYAFDPAIQNMLRSAATDLVRQRHDKKTKEQISEIENGLTKPVIIQKTPIKIKRNPS